MELIFDDVYSDVESASNSLLASSVVSSLFGSISDLKRSTDSFNYSWVCSRVSFLCSLGFISDTTYLSLKDLIDYIYLNT